MPLLVIKSVSSCCSGEFVLYLITKNQAIIIRIKRIKHPKIAAPEALISAVRKPILKLEEVKLLKERDPIDKIYINKI